MDAPSSALIVKTLWPPSDVTLPVYQQTVFYFLTGARKKERTLGGLPMWPQLRRHTMMGVGTPMASHSMVIVSP